MVSSAFMPVRCCLPGVHGVDACSTRSFPRHTHDQFGIGVIRAGAQRSLSGRGMVEAGPGMVITVNPGEVHDGAPIGDGGRRWSMLYFDPAAMETVIAGLGSGGAFEFQAPVLQRSNLARRFARLFDMMTMDNDDALAADEAALMLFSLMTPVPSADRAVLPGISFARARIDDAPGESLSLADLARLAGASRFQTLRAFRRATGLTPHAYLVQRRVALARRLIGQGLPLAEAAAASGFFDQSHMTRHFTRILGITPGAYATLRHEAAISSKTGRRSMR